MGPLANSRGTEGATGFDSGLGSGNPGGVASQAASEAEAGFGVADAFGYGANLAQSFINGIGSLVGSAASKAAELASAAAGAISSALRIGSPSKVALRLADWTVEGFIIPFRDRVGEVEAAATAMGVATARGLEMASDFDRSVWDKWSSFTRGAEAISTANSALGIASPSKVFAKIGGYETVRGRAAQTAPTTVNNYSLNVDGMSAGGKGRIEQLMMEIFAVMLREGVM